MHRTLHALRGTALLGCLALLCGTASAHDFWAEPDTHRPAPGREVVIRLHVGEPHDHEEFPASNRHRLRFEVLGPTTVVPVAPGPDKQPPAGRVTFAEPGLAWIVYQSADSATTLEPKAFAAYLAEEGNERWHADWRQIDPGRTAPVREAFSRCVKALVNVGGGAAGRCRCAPNFGRIAGLPLELVPGLNPLSVRPGGCLPLKLLSGGTPLPGQRVTAVSLAGGGAPSHATTDRCGWVRFTLPTEGAWLIKSVHLGRAKAGEDLEVRSTWTALTFELPAARPQASR